MNGKIYNLSKFRVVLCSWNAKNFERTCPNLHKFRWKCLSFLNTGVLTPYLNGNCIGHVGYASNETLCKLYIHVKILYLL